MLENNVLRIHANNYQGVVRNESKKNSVQGPLEATAEQDVFLLDVNGVKGREALLIHPGNKSWHSKGCVLAGTAMKKKAGDKDVVAVGVPTTLRGMRKAFYGIDGEPNHCPNRIVRITIKDN